MSRAKPNELPRDFRVLRGMVRVAQAATLAEVDARAAEREEGLRRERALIDKSATSHAALSQVEEILAGVSPPLSGGGPIAAGVRDLAARFRMEESSALRWERTSTLQGFALDALAASLFDVSRITDDEQREIVARFLRYVYGVHEWNADEDGRTFPDSSALLSFLDGYRTLENLPHPWGPRAKAGIDRLLAAYAMRRTVPASNGKPDEAATEPVIRRLIDKATGTPPRS